MGNIVNFGDVLSNKIQNENLLSGFEENFSIYLEKYIDEIKENNNVANFDLLLNRSNEVISLFKSGVIESKDVALFLDKLNKILENKDVEINYIYFILYFFNSYKLYGSNFINLPDCDIWIAIELYCTFEMHEDLKILDNLLDGIFDTNSFKKLKSLCKDDKSVRNNYISAYEEFLEDKTNGIPFLYYFKNYVDSYDEEQKDNNKTSVFENEILTPEVVYQNIKDSVSLYANLLHSSSGEQNDSLPNQKAIELLNNLDNMVFKLKNIKEPKRTECLVYIRDVWTDKEKYLYEKIDLTFNEINTLYDDVMVSNKSKL